MTKGACRRTLPPFHLNLVVSSYESLSRRKGQPRPSSAHAPQRHLSFRGETKTAKAYPVRRRRLHKRSFHGVVVSAVLQTADISPAVVCLCLTAWKTSRLNDWTAFRLLFLPYQADCHWLRNTARWRFWNLHALHAVCLFCFCGSRGSSLLSLCSAHELHMTLAR